MIYLRLLILTFILLFINLDILGQQIKNAKAKISDDIINITFDLISKNPNDKFSIKIYSSHDNFLKPLNLISGDVGDDIKPGVGKFAVFQAREELGVFSGYIIFELRANVIISAQTISPEQLVITDPTDGSKLKKGKNTLIKWSGGKQENVKMELFQNSNLLNPIATTTNLGSYNWTVPTDLKGSNYSIKLFNINDPGRAVFSGAFKIKGKVPIYVYFIPVVVGGVAVVLLSGGKKDKALPDAPPPPIN